MSSPLTAYHRSLPRPRALVPDQSFAECAVGAEIFEFLLCSAQCDTREQAQRVCQRLQDKQLLWHVQGSSSAFDVRAACPFPPGRA